ncbi:signal transduction histidine kinase [Panacagrimonas perspica]|uniref:histidine kinase n=1 Tax=Panacagrimonas perspica TaxID=381431 RepID=A0A4S3JZ85_9GAMM|nr:HAMP domain-containing sensor histidine kinase [Panacagrimonas perspica]TDU28487.1 signal transduction histidine kinase [Panacagrimonas perspica]THD00886.1 hypothetical protein B1810_22565 [Panacagrimonas perspica]
MPTIRLGLRARFIAACLLLVSFSTAGYYMAVSQFIEFLEAELRDTTLLGELDEFVRTYEHDPQIPGPRAQGLSSYVLPAGEHPSTLPEILRTLPPGAYEDIVMDGKEVAIARQDVKGARLYVVLDMQRIEDLEEHFVSLAWVCALISWGAAVALALWLARRVLQPVTELAHLVGTLKPGDPTLRLAPRFDDAEIGVIATALDRFMERMEAFISREQAFTEDASHELRTPLAVIDSSAQILAEDPDLSAPAHERVRRILRAAQQMQMLIEALLFLAREEGAYAAEELHLHQLLRDVAENYSEMAAAKNLELSIHSAPAVINAPRGMAACVISNLLINAIHYTDRGRVEVLLEPGRLVVVDTGIGIAPDELGRVFERRFRGSHSRGLGLGLYLVKRICDRLGWRTNVESSPEKGTRFEVLFPSSPATTGRKST